MDIATIDTRYSELEEAARSTAAAVQALGQKLQAEASAGNQQAREWVLDLKEVALELRNQQQQTANLLQALHDFVVAHADDDRHTLQAPPAYQQQAPQYQQPQYQQPQYAQQGGGGLLSRFRSGGFAQALGMGAAFGAGDAIATDIIDDIF